MPTKKGQGSDSRFQKGHKLAKGSNGQIRRDLTTELISQLNETIECADGMKRTKLHRVVKNLIAQAIGTDMVNSDGTITESTGDLMAIKEIFDRLEGRPKQRIVGPADGPVQTEFRTVEEVRMFLLERGIDSLRVPPPLKLIDCGKGS